MSTIDLLPADVADDYRRYVRAKQLGRRVTARQREANRIYQETWRRSRGVRPAAVASRARGAAGEAVRAKHDGQYRDLRAGGMTHFAAVWALSRRHLTEYLRAYRAEVERLTRKPWFVFYGTEVAVVWAASDRDAYISFARTFTKARRGALCPLPSEVKVRSPRRADRRWVEQHADAAAFVEALEHAGTP